MDISTIVGLLGSITVVITTMYLEGSGLGSYLIFSAFLLIAGGSLCVAITCFGLKEGFFGIPKYFRYVIFPPKTDVPNLIITFVSFSEKARREGLLSLEDDINEIDDPMINKGLQLVIDGADPETVRNILEEMADKMNKHDKIPAEVFETLGGFSPTLGIIGTVMGLVHVLENLGGANITALGEGIAVAFIATFYGIGFANLIWLPLVSKVKMIAGREAEMREIIISGVMTIQSGDNPSIVKDKLICHISDPEIRDNINEIVNKE
jgi:chemotaxis protein MotA